MKQELKCLFCSAELPERADYDNYHRCACGAVYGFEDQTDGFEFACQAADMLGIPDGEPLARIAQLEIKSEPFDGLDGEDEVYAFFARLKEGQ